MRRALIRWWHIAVALALVALLDIYEMVITIPALSDMAETVIFDLRVSGYTQSQAAALLAALGPDGRWFYLTRHVPADTALALIEAIAIVLILVRVTRPGARFSLRVADPWRVALLMAPVLMLVFDLGENALVAHMLAGGAPDRTLVAITSLMTQAKWVMISLAIALAVILPCAYWIRSLRRRSAPNLSRST